MKTIKHILSRYTAFLWALLKPLGAWGVLAIAAFDGAFLGLPMDAVVADGPYESTSELHAALGPAISARYREWRSRDLDGLLGDLLAAAYARGAFDATPSGARLRWVPAEVGQQVAEGDTVAILESMKMEIPVESPVAGTITQINVAPNDQVTEGDLIAVIE